MEIRVATFTDIDRLPDIERSAGGAFFGSSQAAVVSDQVTPAEAYTPFVPEGLVWVATDREAIIGFNR